MDTQQRVNQARINHGYCTSESDGPAKLPLNISGEMRKAADRTLARLKTRISPTLKFIPKEQSRGY